MLPNSIVCVYNVHVCCVFIHVQDPKLYVHALLEVHNKYKVMVEAAFKGDAGFIQALDKVRSIAVCRYVVISLPPSPFSLPPSLLFSLPLRLAVVSLTVTQ